MVLDEVKMGTPQKSAMINGVVNTSHENTTMVVWIYDGV
jgi:hypothetical protein